MLVLIWTNEFVHPLTLQTLTKYFVFERMPMIFFMFNVLTLHSILEIIITGLFLYLENLCFTVLYKSLMILNL